MLSPSVLVAQYRSHKIVSARRETSSRMMINVLQDLLPVRNHSNGRYKYENHKSASVAPNILHNITITEIYRRYDYNATKKKASFHSSGNRNKRETLSSETEGQAQDLTKAMLSTTNC